MTAIVLLSPKRNTKAASRAEIADRSRREPNTLFIVSTLGLLVRGGTIEPVRGQALTVITTLAAGPGGFACHDTLVSALWGCREDGGVQRPRNQISTVLNQVAEQLAALKIRVEADYQHGRRLILDRISGRGAPTGVAIRVERSTAYWVPRAKEMRARGATYKAIGEAVGRAQTTVCQVLNGRRYGKGGRHTQASPEARQRCLDREEARREAKRTGEPVEQIYARWGCETVDRSLLWDLRKSQKDIHA